MQPYFIFPPIKLSSLWPSDKKKNKLNKHCYAAYILILLIFWLAEQKINIFLP